MLLYNVSYEKNGVPQREYDREVPDTYLDDLVAGLGPDEIAYAYCLNNPHEHRQITRAGVQRWPAP